ncbi:MAG: UDP-N-acetylmuramate dehydrogenase [Clostridia bacterium]|nr:UDP-N-acetylmuramate dehydrogenase [Clostridia bacterium]
MDRLQTWRQWWHSKERRGQLTENMPMRECTTLRLGGAADLFLEAADPEETAEGMQTARALGLPVTLIGAGSNLLVRDGGIRGLTVRVGKGMREVRISGNTLTAQAGCMLSSLSLQCAHQGLSGLEFACGIPGTVGGGSIMNAGAYGGEMKDVITLVRGVSAQGQAFEKTGEEMAFGYRHSALMGMDAVIFSVDMRLQRGEPEDMLARIRSLKEQRALKQPLDVPSAGSTFKRPEGAFAAALIDQCGLRGLSVGGAQVSEKHAGFLVNRGDSSRDYLALIAQVQHIVRERTGYELECEIRIVGED